uniref:HTH psq-type domain-containing protein n=1 Tax=Romanomermis culicivorax TaxID=13658 RepID=A0A915KAN2_ROMCU
MRNYKRKLSARRYGDYSKEDLEAAVQFCRDGMPVREVAVLYLNISKSTINRKVNSKNIERHGHRTGLTREEESTSQSDCADSRHNRVYTTVESLICVQPETFLDLFLHYKRWKESSHSDVSLPKKRTR